MGREIRRVPPQWEHPLKEGREKTIRSFRGHEYPNFQPKYEKQFLSASQEWKDGFAAHTPSEENDFSEYWEWDGNPPDRDYYVDYDPKDKKLCTWYQMYETVSEGTPVTPAFETQEQLAQYLHTNGTFWDPKPWDIEAAKRFVSAGYAPSMMISGGKIYTAENMPDLNNNR